MEEDFLLFDNTIKKIAFLFRFAGVNIKSGEQTTNGFKSRIIYIINLFWLNVDLAGGIYWFIDGARTGKDFLGLTYIAPCISLSTLANFKILFLIQHKKKVHKLIDILRKLEIQGKERGQSLEKDDIANKHKNSLDAMFVKLNILFALSVITFALSPLLIMSVKYYQTSEVELILPFLIMYPFDPFQMKVWPFVYLHQIWSACVVTLNITTADYFFYTCCTYISIQFRCLRHDLQNIIPEDRYNNKVLENEIIENKLKDLVTWHQNLIECANILEIIYSKSTLINFLTSSLIICLTGFNVTVMTNDIPFVTIFLSFLLMGMVQIFFLCYFADLLTSSSLGICEAVYNSRWYIAEARIGKKFLVVLKRAQRPCKISACGYTDVDLNSFMKVLSTAWSYFALLQTMYGE